MLKHNLIYEVREYPRNVRLDQVCKTIYDKGFRKGYFSNGNDQERY